MTGQQTLDLVHELQVELGWQPDFAQAAHGEYMRWLRLRVQSGDFQNCKLPPSRVVAMVWSLHRQWTLDYEDTCTQLGGFIHHFPPAMRMNLAREQAYAATIHTYKTIFKEDPPSSYWGPAICSYKPLTSDGPTQAFPVRNTPHRPTPSLRRSPTKRDAGHRASIASKPKNKVIEALTRRSSAPVASASAVAPADRTRSNTDDPRPRSRASKASKDPKSTGTMPSDDVVVKEDSNPRSVKKERRKFPGASSLYILKPLRPGEKRKRGRPSFADYVLASGTEGVSLPEPKKKESKTTTADKIISPKSPRSTSHVLRRRKSIASPRKPLNATPVITKKEKAHAKSSRRVGRPPASNPASSPSTNGKRTSKDVAAITEKTTSPTNRSEQDPKDTAVPGKRPRGRPRKDGSWPVPRGRKTDAASKPAPSVAPKPAPMASARDEGVELQEKEDKLKNAKENEQTTSTVETPPSITTPAPGPRKSSSPAPGPDPAPSVSPAQAGAVLPVTSTGTSAPAGTTPQTKDVMANDDKSAGVDKLGVPAKIIDTADIQMQDLSDKGEVKSQGVPENVPRDPMFDQVMDNSELVEKERQGDVGNSLIGNDVRIGQDVVFPQSEPLREPVDIDMPLGPPPRSDSVPNAPGAVPVVAFSGQGQTASEKFMSQEGTFPMNSKIVSQVASVPNSMDGGILPIGPSGVDAKLDVGNEKDDQMDDGDPKKPFKRPRGRPRKDGSWPNARPKPMNDEAVDRVKDLNDPTQSVNFPMGSSGTV